MSAIVGVYNLDGRPVDPDLLGTMLEYAAPWPADAQDIWHDGKVGFGHRMLHTTPESMHEKLPLYDADHFAITADARIDNRKELIAKLSLGKNNAKALSDSELILQAYKKWGDDCTWIQRCI